MTSARLPTSVAVSLGLHGGLLILFGLSLREGPKQAPRMVEGVDLLIQAPKRAQAAEAAPRPKAPLSTLDFLKLALPSAPRASAPARLDMRIPERKLAPTEAPRLEEKSRKESRPKIENLDMTRERASAASLDVKLQTRRQAAETLAALPRLEDVGRRRVANLPEAVALEERRREAVAAQGVPELAIKPVSRRQALAAVSALRDAEPAERAPERRGLAALLPEKPLVISERPAPVMAPRISAQSPAFERRQVQAATGEKTKAVEIEGPLADRKVAAYQVPPFPSWLQSQGILETSVAIRFTVDETGSVMAGMRVVGSSGYGRLDKLAMEALRGWRFVPKPGAGVQWGVITFRFVLE